MLISIIQLQIFLLVCSRNLLNWELFQVSKVVYCIGCFDVQVNSENCVSIVNVVM